MKLVVVELEELQDIISRIVKIEAAKLEGKLLTSDELGKIGGLSMAEEITGLSRSRIRTLAAKRYTDNGIPCVLGRNSQLKFSTVALNLWEMGKSCQELTEWMEERKNMTLI